MKGCFFIIVPALLLLAACASHAAKNDADTVTPDGDVPTVDDAVETEADDFIFVEADELLPDADTPVSCLSMKIRENVKKAGFPLKDANGKITFCRPGCDTPSDNDPQCVRNLWDWINWTRYQNYKNGTETYTECYPWPCVLPKVTSSPVSYSPCDTMISNKDFQADMASLYDLRISNGNVGLVMVGSKSSKAILYNTQKKTYETVGHSGPATSYNYDRFLFFTTEEDYVNNENVGYGKTYIVSAKKNAAGYKYEVIYDDPEHMARFSRPPLVGEKWVVLNVEHRATNIIEVVYSKVDEWEWHSLKPGRVYEGNIVGDHLTFKDPGGGIYYCDLTKLPFDPAKECARIDRTGESVNDPRLNEENQYQLVYNEQTKNAIVLVDLTTATPTYTEIPVTPTENNYVGALNDQFKGNVLLYSEMYVQESSGEQDLKACFYRFDLNKQYCAKTKDPVYFKYGMGFNSFDGNYMLWKRTSGLTYTRDIQCYCEKEGVCPFEGLKK